MLAKQKLHTEIDLFFAIGFFQIIALMFENECDSHIHCMDTLKMDTMDTKFRTVPSFSSGYMSVDVQKCF